MKLRNDLLEQMGANEERKYFEKRANEVQDILDDERMRRDRWVDDD